jgi:uncharacterized protein (TIGR02117 family)
LFRFILNHLGKNKPVNEERLKLKKILKVISLTLLSLVLLVGIYIGLAYSLSRMSTECEPTTSKDVLVFILTNGVHTDIVVPVKHPLVDWSREVKFENTVGKDSLMKYVAFGWGDKGFYLETPTWADLKFSVAFKAATSLSTSAIHATYYKELKENESCKGIYISHQQYERLVNYIRGSFQTNGEGRFINIKTNANYGNDDAFYEAKRRYSIFHTCNTWANNALKSCGQKASVWTPFDTGIFYHYKK